MCFLDFIWPLIYFYEILFRLWVAVCLLESIWNLNCWYAFMKLYLGCELLYFSWPLFELLTYLYELLSRVWVSVHLLGSIWIGADMPLWISIQSVSCCASSGLYINCWYALMKSYLGCEFLVPVQCLGSIWIGTDMLPLWNSIQNVSCYVPFELYINH